MFAYSLRMRATLVALGTLGCLVSCSKENPTPAPTAQAATADGKQLPPTQQEQKTAWDTFVQNVEKGEWKDALNQYVSKSTRVDDNSPNRPSRPKVDISQRQFKRVTQQASNGDVSVNLIPIDCPDCGGGGGPTPPSYTFVTTEMVVPYNRPSTNTKGGSLPIGVQTNDFYSTENPQGYLMDVKIVKGTGAGEPPFYNDYRYHNINVDLNKGAGGEYIYVSFTREPNAVHDHDNNTTFGKGKDERQYSTISPYAIIHNPITDVKTEINTLTRPSEYYPIKNGIAYSPMWAQSPWPSWDSDDMKFPDLNDGAGGRFIYGFQSKSSFAGTPIELGVLASNSSSTQPPTGWKKVTGDLNEGAGGDFIYFCIRHR